MVDDTVFDCVEMSILEWPMQTRSCVVKIDLKEEVNSIRMKIDFNVIFDHSSLLGIKVA